MTIQEILNSNKPQLIRALFQFSKEDSNEAVLFKLNIWSRHYFPKHFKSLDAEFHQKKINLHNLQVLRGQIRSYVDSAFRGAAKTDKTKLIFAYWILNDSDRSKKYFKILSEDGANSKQSVTDIYNMLAAPRITEIWPETFEKTTAKREETMASFTTTTGIKVVAGTVGTDQRGAIQEESRPDVIWFDDFETRATLRSARKTKAIWENMEEARNGLSKDGGCIYTCNYLSEQGNVHRLITQGSGGRAIDIIPIIDENGKPTWPERYTVAEIDQMRKDDDDFEGEKLCKPSASKDIYFDRETLDRMVAKIPIREIAGFKIYKKYDPSHRYASGHDVGHGVELDSSTSVFIDFDTVPAQVSATFANNTIKSDNFGDEIAKESDIFGGSLAAIEKNDQGNTTIMRARQLEVNLYKTQTKDTKINQGNTTEYGWHTNALSKPKMLSAFAKAITDGLIELNDPALIQEAKDYTRNDLIENVTDPRLTTRHFDLLIGAAIAWQMKDFAAVAEEKESKEEYEEEKPLYSDIGI